MKSIKCKICGVSVIMVDRSKRVQHWNTISEVERSLTLTDRAGSLHRDIQGNNLNGAVFREASGLEAIFFIS